MCYEGHNNCEVFPSKQIHGLYYSKHKTNPNWATFYRVPDDAQKYQGHEK